MAELVHVGIYHKHVKLTFRGFRAKKNCPKSKKNPSFRPPNESFSSKVKNLWNFYLTEMLHM